MSKLAMKLLNEREVRNADYMALLRGIFSGVDPNLALNQDPKLAAAMEDAMYELDMHGAFGLLERYFVEEYYFRGKSKEEIGKELAANINLLVDDLEVSSLRFLRHPKCSRPLANFIRRQEENHQ